MADTKTERPECVTDEHLEFLDDLRESGKTNTFGASAYVRDEFAVDRDTAQKIVGYWMKTFGQETR